MAFRIELPQRAAFESMRTESGLNHDSPFVRNFRSDLAGPGQIVINHERKRLSLAALEKTPPHKRFVISEGRMKKFVLASLFPALAAKAAEPKLCGKGTKICACGKLPAAMWQCCNAKAKCDCSGGLPNCKNH